MSDVFDCKVLEEKLDRLRQAGRRPRIAIVGLGSVGNYLLNYLLGSERAMDVVLMGRSREKMQADLNIARVAADIRGQVPKGWQIVEVDLGDVNQLAEALDRSAPDLLVNASRAYAHIKYGSISWNTVRAYGIWAPLSVKYAKNIMKAIALSNHRPIVINTSYSDAVNAWLRTGGLPHPDFGSGNLNHLLPRVRFAAAELAGVTDFEHIDITLATSHFHDVVISKEGQVEGVMPLISLRYQGRALELDMNAVYARCAIPMPVDARRNMMNASSNFEIIDKVLAVALDSADLKLHVPGALGMVGGYPLRLDGRGSGCQVSVDERCWPLQQMCEANDRSIYLDGIAGVADGVLTYTDELLEKTERHFGVRLPKRVPLADSDAVAQLLIEQIIEKRK